MTESSLSTANRTHGIGIRLTAVAVVDVAGVEADAPREVVVVGGGSRRPVIGRHGIGKDRGVDGGIPAISDDGLKFIDIRQPPVGETAETAVVERLEEGLRIRRAATGSRSAGPLIAVVRRRIPVAPGEGLRSVMDRTIAGFVLPDQPRYVVPDHGPSFGGVSQSIAGCVKLRVGGRIDQVVPILTVEGLARSGTEDLLGVVIAFRLSRIRQRPGVNIDGGDEQEN